MPLFNYQCLNCDNIVEKFQHKSLDVVEIICQKCGKTKFERLMSASHNRVTLGAKDTYSQKIKPDVERISNNIKKGKDKDFLDLHGDK